MSMWTAIGAEIAYVFNIGYLCTVNNGLLFRNMLPPTTVILCQAEGIIFTQAQTIHHFWPTDAVSLLLHAEITQNVFP